MGKSHPRPAFGGKWCTRVGRVNLVIWLDLPRPFANRCCRDNMDEFRAAWEAKVHKVVLALDEVGVFDALI